MATNEQGPRTAGEVVAAARGQLLHNVVVHPVIGVAYLVADVFDVPELERWADELHDQTAPED